MEHIEPVENPDKQINNYNLFANWNIKYTLLVHSINYLKLNSKNTETLLDLASGKGNDLNRWIKVGLKKVFGVEYSKEQLIEAIKRNNRKIFVKYIHGSMTDINLIENIIKENKNKFNLITNNFAMNHIFNSDENIDNFFKTVSFALNNEGLFIGTATDGDMLEILFDFKNKIDNPLYNIEKLYDNKNLNSGKKYKFKINTPFFKDNPIEEYIINKKNLLKYAEKYNLIPFTTINGLDPISNFGNFPIVKNEQTDIYMDRPIGIASLYFTFSFIKKQINYDYEIIKINNINTCKSSFFIIDDDNYESDKIEFLYNPIIYNKNIYSMYYETYDKYPEPIDIKRIIIHKEIYQKIKNIPKNLNELFDSIKQIGIPYVLRTY